MREAYRKLEHLATSFHDNVSLISASEFEYEGENCLPQLFGKRARPTNIEETFSS